MQARRVGNRRRKQFISSTYQQPVTNSTKATCHQALFRNGGLEARHPTANQSQRSPPSPRSLELRLRDGSSSPCFFFSLSPLPAYHPSSYSRGRRPRSLNSSTIH